MRSIDWPLALCVAACLLLSAAPAQAGPEETVLLADSTLREIMGMSFDRIPQALLVEAQGVAIIPDVIKIGFVAALRRGHGVVVVRSADGAWSAPQFVTLTGGSVGWQVGVQDTDVVLVFMTQKSVEGLLNGKFTIGADAAAAAGPVGRNAAAATDARLKAEILSYSRSRGLFAGVSLDGSVIEVDTLASSQYYAGGNVPASTSQLITDLNTFSRPEANAPAVNGANLTPPNLPTLAGGSGVRPQLAAASRRLSGVVDDGWRKYLALPSEVYTSGEPPRIESLQAALKQYDRVRQDEQYRALANRAEFIATYDLLQSYARERSAQAGALALPPPPKR